MKRISLSMRVALRNDIEKYRHDYNTGNRTNAVVCLINEGIKIHNENPAAHLSCHVDGNDTPYCNFSVSIEDDMLQSIEDFRYEAGLSTRSSAIVMLVRMGLSAYYKEP
jgi:hypothetical protein